MTHSALGVLTVLPGGQDELPEGPNGLDGLDEAAYLTTDLPRRRPARYDFQGAYRQEWNIGFGADAITVMPTGLVQVREASTGGVYIFDREGKLRPGESAVLAEAAEAHLLTSKRSWHGRRGRARGETREIRLDDGFGGNLGTGDQCYTFVALEATGAGESVNVNRNTFANMDRKLVSENHGYAVHYFVRR
jgi:hypothetical protein